MKYNDLLIVFVDNPVEGETKTGLSREIGADAALTLHNRFIEYTCKIASKVSFVDVAVYYSIAPIENDTWSLIQCKKYTQSGSNLQNSVKHAFYDNFNKGYKRIVLIGSSCLEINEHKINKAFDILYTGKSVLGPTNDGGLYMIGLNSAFPQFFNHDKWNTKELFKQSMYEMQDMNMNFAILEKTTIIRKLAHIEPHYEKLAKLKRETRENLVTVS